LRVLTQRVPMDGFNALLVVCEGLGDFVVFRAGRRPIVCICLTPLRIAFDPHYRQRYMETRGFSSRLLVRLGSPVFRWADRLAWRRYDRVFCISQEVKRRVLAGKLAPEDKLEVAYVGLGFEPPESCGALGDYFLLPGRIMWTKNIELGLGAFRRFRAMRPEFGRFRLVIAGIVDRKSEPYLARLREMAGNDPGIEFRIFPSDEELYALYDRCYTVLFTAFNEDWGIVPVESMAFGKPVIAVNRGGPRESIQHGVQGFLEEPEVESFAGRMAELAASPAAAAAMGQAGRERARLYSWDRLTKQVDDQIESLCHAYRRGPVPAGRRR
jgi:glycosyltransferase involved in cell wall biosynthesis